MTDGLLFPLYVEERHAERDGQRKRTNRTAMNWDDRPAPTLLLVAANQRTVFQILR